MHTFLEFIKNIFPRIFFQQLNKNSPYHHLDPLGPSTLFGIPRFEEEIEQLFWQDRHPTMLKSLKLALLLGAMAFLTCIVLDVLSGIISIPAALVRMSIVLVLIMLAGHLHYYPQADSKIKCIAKLSAGLSASYLIAVLLIDEKPANYAETWPGLLPMYFFSYGQMFMSLRATIIFGWTTALAMMLSGHLIGVESIALMPSLLNLLIVNIFGGCTRCQLEAYSRKSFRDKRNTEQCTLNKTQFLHQFSHNLRQPLQAMSCYTSALETACIVQADNHLQHIVSRMGFTIDELNNTFNYILDIINLENGKQIPRLTTVNINVLLSAMEDQFAPQAAKHGLKLKVCRRNRPPYNIYSDVGILQQIVGNLIDNAIKYTRTGWIIVSVVKIGGDQLKLHVYDSGIGIADEEREHIFKEFFRGHRRQTDLHAQGMGIGLAYVSTAIQHLPNHRLHLDSRPNHGSDFQLYLPVINSTPNLITTLQQPTMLAGSFVLVVDDDHEVLTALASQLISWECLVQTATSLLETKTALADILRTPELLITDFYLDNHETAQDIITVVQAECGAVPTLILSARAIPDAEKAKWPENTLLLRKPASPGILMEMMARAMGK